MKKKIRVSVCVLVILIGILMLYRSPVAYIMPGYHRFLYTQNDYDNLVRTIKKRQIQTHFSHKTATNKQLLMDRASKKLMSDMIQLFKYWYGTTYDFYGTSEKPGEGKIACGYFVTTILRDAGFKVKRRRWAQYPSEKLIRALIDKRHIKIYSGMSLIDFIEKVKQMGEGIYIVGLDTHIGFLVCKNDYVHFVHASQRGLSCVRKESAYQSMTLKKSVYRVVGKLTKDQNKAMQNWLNHIRS